MNEFFNDQGHLTAAAFNALAQQQPLDELTRLECAEHLAFCDECIEAYCLFLTDDLLLDPPAPQSAAAIRRAKSAELRVLAGRYVRAAIAAGFAITLWAGGVFSFDYVGKSGEALASAASSAVVFSQQVDQWKLGFSEGLASFFNHAQKDQPGNDQKGASSNEKE